MRVRGCGRAHPIPNQAVIFLVILASDARRRAAGEFAALLSPLLQAGDAAGGGYQQVGGGGGHVAVRFNQQLPDKILEMWRNVYLDVTPCALTDDGQAGDAVAGVEQLAGYVGTALGLWRARACALAMMRPCPYALIGRCRCVRGLMLAEVLTGGVWVPGAEQVAQSPPAHIVGCQRQPGSGARSVGALGRRRFHRGYVGCTGPLVPGQAAGRRVLRRASSSLRDDGAHALPHAGSHSNTSLQRLVHACISGASSRDAAAAAAELPRTHPAHDGRRLGARLLRRAPPLPLRRLPRALGGPRGAHVPIWPAEAASRAANAAAPAADGKRG